MRRRWLRRQDHLPGLPASARVFDIARAVVLGDARQLAQLDPPPLRVLSAAFDALSLADRICPV
ncbi:MAG: hypothetical protein L0H54_11880, partial [Alcaligenaceae bacterium]|nr:hypothetical protein [Alcaligenaceae bacterium]